MSFLGLQKTGITYILVSYSIKDICIDITFLNIQVVVPLVVIFIQ